MVSISYDSYELGMTIPELMGIHHGTYVMFISGNFGFSATKIWSKSTDMTYDDSQCGNQHGWFPGSFMVMVMEERGTYEPKYLISY